MSLSDIPMREESQRARLPRRAALIPVLFLLGHVGGPWAISWLSTRHGWSHGRPGRRNLLALLLVGAGTAGVSWCLSLHFGASTGLLEMERTPRSLLVRGPYRFTRNPMFLSELAIWLGWTLFYGSVAVFVGCVLFWLFVLFQAVPWEERELEARFGESYRRYKNSVPRWLGKIRG
jgi:protein-S-isoprenylcysteine O-methyltransferase Ste14